MLLTTLFGMHFFTASIARTPSPLPKHSIPRGAYFVKAEVVPRNCLFSNRQPGFSQRDTDYGCK
jgi:hypothetical protein